MNNLTIFKNTKAVVLGVLFLATSITASASEPKIKSPNSLIAASVSCNNFIANISWTTSEESIKSTYLITKTKDGINYETVGTVNNSVNGDITKVAHEYTIVDETPYTGISYYKITEFDGDNNMINMSTVVYTPCENEEQINAVIEHNQITIAVNSTCEANNVCNVSVVDLKNKTVSMGETYKVVQGMNTYKIENKLDAGTYKLIVEHKNHKRYLKEFKIQ